MQKGLLDGSVLGHWPPNFLAPGISSVEDSFSMDWVRGWFQDNSSVLHLMCPLFLLLLYQLHLTSSGIRSWRLGTPVLECVRGYNTSEMQVNIF